MNDDPPKCDAETAGYDGMFGVYCSLPAGHSGPHNDDYVEWDHVDPKFRNSAKTQLARLLDLLHEFGIQPHVEHVAAGARHTRRPPGTVVVTLTDRTPGCSGSFTGEMIFTFSADGDFRSAEVYGD